MADPSADDERSEEAASINIVPASIPTSPLPALLILAADDGAACVDETCLPLERET
jgi:hypothetical protein